jgi:hypothetical protein
MSLKDCPNRYGVCGGSSRIEIDETITVDEYSPDVAPDVTVVSEILLICDNCGAKAIPSRCVDCGSLNPDVIWLDGKPHKSTFYDCWSCGRHEMDPQFFKDIGLA